MFLSEWREFPLAPCFARKKKPWWQLASRCCWNRARPCHASELVSFLVGLRTYQHHGKNICCVWRRICSFWSGDKLLFCHDEICLFSRERKSNFWRQHGVPVLQNDSGRLDDRQYVTSHPVQWDISTLWSATVSYRATGEEAGHTAATLKQVSYCDSYWMTLRRGFCFGIAYSVRTNQRILFYWTC